MPDKPPPPGAIEILSVRPTTPEATTAFAPTPKRPRAKKLVPWLLAALTMGAAIWVFATIRPVAITTQPTADNIRLEGQWAWRSGDTWYLTAGDWRASAKLTGHETLDQPFLVSRTGVNSFNFTFTPLPGYLDLTILDDRSKQPVLDATATVNNEPFAPELGIDIGTATIRVSHPDFLDNRQDITIQGLGERQKLTVILTPKRGTLAIPSIPKNAIVREGDVILGSGPGEWELLPGEKQINIECEGKQPWSTSIKIESGKQTLIDTVELIPIPATITFESDPPGAQISLDEALAGVAPFTRTLSPGVYAGRAILPGYSPTDLLIELKPGDRVTKSFVLKPLRGKLTIEAPSGSEISIDGKPWLDPMPAEIPIGLRQIEVRMPGHPPVIRPIVIRTDRHATLTFSLPPKKQSPKEPPHERPLIENPLPYGIKPIRISIPKTPLQVGSPRNERNRRSNESIRNVQLTRDIELSATEITNAQFLKFAPGHSSGPGLDGPEQPVVSISWDQAARFCNHLNELQGLPQTYREKDQKMIPIHPIPDGWRLPTESEWAITARLAAPKNATYPWGSNLKPKDPHYNLADETATTNRKLEGYNDKHEKSSPVASFPADQLRLFDLAGNVSEWCHDYYSLSAPNASRIEIDPTGPNSGIHHIIRGSSYNHHTAERLRIALRDYSSTKRDDVGFRICRFAPKEIP